MRSTLHRRLIMPIAAAGTLALVLSGCVGDDPGTVEEADCADYEQYGTFEGEEVSVYSTILDAEAERLEESWAVFEQCTGIEVAYQGTDEFEAQVRVLVEGDNAPDLAIFPQPGLFATFADDLAEAPAAVAENANEYWNESWVGFGTVDGTFYGAPLMASVKGLIWYSPSVWDENGWEIPTTLDGLTEVTEQIASEGTMLPWCAGFSSGEASGWPGTDWIEDFVLRLHGPEVYDEWIAHEIPFNDPRIVEAFDAAGDILKNPDFVNGGYGDVRSINDITFEQGGWPVLDAECGMHHQASFYEGIFPEGTTVAEDGDVWAFVMPGAEEGSSAVTGGGEIVGAFNDSEATQALQTYLSSSEWANIRVEIGGVVSANNGVDPSLASSELLGSVIEALQDENTTFAFDASDLMPGAVGSDSFWKGIVAWIGGQSTQATVDAIEASWPAE